MNGTNDKLHKGWELKINSLGLFLGAFGVSCILDSVARLVTACKKSK